MTADTDATITALREKNGLRQVRVTLRETLRYLDALLADAAPAAALVVASQEATALERERIEAPWRALAAHVSEVLTGEDEADLLELRAEARALLAKPDSEEVT